MDTVLMEPEMSRIVRVFFWTGSVAHLLDLDAPTDLDPKRAPTICGLKLLWPAEWLGLDGVEPEDQKHKPTCGRCAKSLEVHGGKLP